MAADETTGKSTITILERGVVDVAHAFQWLWRGTALISDMPNIRNFLSGAKYTSLLDGVTQYLPWVRFLLRMTARSIKSALLSHGISDFQSPNSEFAKSEKKYPVKITLEYAH
jgi:hypothetical protein